MRNADLAQRLDELGFFRLADDPSTARQSVEERGWAGIYGENGRWYFADAEDLAEGGVGSFVRGLASLFGKLGLAVPMVVDRFGPRDEDGYTVFVNGRPYVIWSKDDSAAEKTRPGLVWAVSGVHTVDILNDLLSSAELRERAYGILGGNDFAIMFLTPGQFQAIRSAPGYKATEGPYVPRTDHPMFGMPEQ